MAASALSFPALANEVMGTFDNPMIDLVRSIDPATRAIRKQLVGLMFHGNVHSVAGRYWFNPENNRPIALHPAIIREALDKVYGAKELLSELQDRLVTTVRPSFCRKRGPRAPSKLRA
ncbi:MAG TPA: S46 family peptidase [Steroidobacteraceae bacterium]|nr:S46 family peptidase [Steroidobacteraceae bacterium]